MILFSFFILILPINYIKDISIIFSFHIVAIPMIIMFYKILKYDYLYFETTILVFYLLFLFMAPIIQISTGILPNTMEIKTDLIVKTNLISSLFLIIYIIVRFLKVNNSMQIECNLGNKFRLKYPKSVLMIMFIIFLIVFLRDIDYLVNRAFYRTGAYSNGLDNNKMARLLIENFVYNFILFILTYKFYLISINDKKINIMTCVKILLITFLFLCVKNFFTGSRGTVGAIYIAILIYIINIFKEKKINCLSIFIVMLMIFAFINPFIETIVHLHGGIIELINGNVNLVTQYKINLENGFNSLDYDAWSNMAATIEYVSKNSVTFGRQILGSLFFFIPRGLWVTKPGGTGELIGNYLISNYSMWFNNLSNPIPSEGYVDFGVFGVIIFGIVLGMIGRYVKKLIISDSYLKFIGYYVSLQNILFMRGDMISSIAFLVGTIVAIFFIPYIIDTLIYNFKKIN